MRRPILTLFVLTTACFDPKVPELTGFEPGPATTGPEPGTADATDGVPSSCSNEVVDEDETDVDCGGSCLPCDDGRSCTAAADCASGVCVDGSCAAPVCGDGVVQDGEACDQGGATATCTAQCTVVACGDGLVTEGEACDDAGESATCNADCTVAACGDGILNATAGEECESTGPTAECNEDCTLAVCGDGQTNPAAGEDCDDGGNTATCNADCTTASCGDGFINSAAGEQCDGAGETATCNADCTTASCGDGIVNVAAGEACDGGAMCSATCQFLGCAPDPVALAMAACMAQYPNCEVQDGGVVGFGAGQSVGSNCGTPASPWRWYCTQTSDGSNYHCAACTVGEILGPHDPCNCNPGTAPVLDTFCTL